MPVHANASSCSACCDMQVLEEQLAWRGGAVAPLRPALLRTLADVQHRLTFRAQAFIKVRMRSLNPPLPPDPARCHGMCMPLLGVVQLCC